jgi:hypothetical protein
MHKPLSHLRKKKSSQISEPLPSIPFSQRFEGKISHVSKLGLHEVLLASRDSTSRESSTKLEESEICKSIVKTYRRRKSEAKIVDTSIEDK